MSHINISLSANTASYVKRLKAAKTETDRNVILMEKRIDEFAQNVGKNLADTNTMLSTFTNGLAAMGKGGGIAAGVVAVGVAFLGVGSAIHQMNQASMEQERLLIKAANHARMTTAEFQLLGRAIGHTGVDIEQMGQISKDVFDRLGDYATAGAGPLVDLFELSGDGSIALSDFYDMDALEVLQRIVNEMERVGASGAQITFIMESIGSSAADLYPMLRNNGQELKRMQELLKDIEATPITMQSSKDAILVLGKSWESMWNSMGTFGTQEFEGIYKVVTRISNAINGWAVDGIIENRAEALESLARKAGVLGSVDHSQDSNQLTEESKAISYNIQKLEERKKLLESQTGLSAKRKAEREEEIKALEVQIGLWEHEKKVTEDIVASRKRMDTAASSSMQHMALDGKQNKALGTNFPELKKEAGEVESLVQKTLEYRDKVANSIFELRAQLVDIHDTDLKTQLEKELKEQEGAHKTSGEALSNALMRQADIKRKHRDVELQEQIKHLQLEMGLTTDAVEQEQFRTQIQTIENQRRVNNEVDAYGKRLHTQEDYQRMELKNQTDHAKKINDILVNKINTELGLQAKYSDDKQEQATITYNQEVLALDKQLRDKLISEQAYLDARKGAHEKHLRDTAQLWRDQEAIRLKVVTDSATTEMGQLQAKHQVELHALKDRKAKEKLTTEQYNGLLLALGLKHKEEETALLQSQENDKAQIKADAAIGSMAQLLARQEAETTQLYQRFENEKISYQEQLGMVLNLQRTQLEEQNQLKVDNAIGEQERLVTQREAEYEALMFDYENKYISHEQYLAAKQELDQKYNDANAQMNSLVIQEAQGVVANIEKITKEGSTAQKIAFAMNKALAIANATIMMNTNAEAARQSVLTAGAGDPTALARAELAANLSKVASAINIGAMVGTTIGQFHSGADEVDQTGSYILKQGERVIQPTANKDLTQYLKSNNSNSSKATEIKSDLIIQGDTTISDEKFQYMLAQHRESLAQFVRLAQRENPSI